MSKVVQVGVSKHNRGGITTVLKAWESSCIWDKYSCKWIETQDNRGLFYKFYYLTRSFLLSLYYIPRCDIAHFHTVPGVSIIVQMPIFLLCLLFRKKVVVQLHVGNQLEDHTNDSLFKWVLNKSSKIVVLAYVWRNLLVARYGIKEDKVAVLYNAAPVVKSSDVKQNYVLYMAYLVKNKGYDVLIKGFSKAVKSFPNWKLIIAGTGEIEEAQKLAEQLQVGKNIEFRNWVTGDEREDLWLHAGAFCMASYQEGFPMTVLEAWSYGTPLVTTPVGGLPDVIRHGDNALIFGFGDADELASCFKQLFSSESLLRSLSKASKKLAKKTFGLESIVKDIEQLYDSL